MDRFYIKYARRRFSDLYGIEYLIPTIRSIVDNERYHGVLVTGDYGSGKTTIARALLCRSQCMDPQGLDPCLKCPRCKCVLEGIDPILGNTKILKGSEITRDLLIDGYLTYCYFIGGSSNFLMIDDLDEMFPRMLNILKGSMDEWKSMYFFFTATNLDNFPNALLQRTIHVRIEKANDVDLRQLIIDVCAAENIRVQDEAAIQKLIRLCRSNFRNVLNTLEWLKGVESGLNSESLENPIIRTHAGLGINLKN